MLQSLRLISLLLALSASSLLKAQQLFPVQAGNKVRYRVMMEMPKAYISGVCILFNDSSEVKGSIFNEFGVSAIDFAYDPSKDKVKLHHMMKMLDKWYVKRVLRKDLLAMMHQLENGVYEYDDTKYKLRLRFSPMVELEPIND